MRALAYERAFDALYSYFTSFGYFSDAENEGVLANIARALRPGARFLLDVANRDWMLTHPRHRTWSQRDDGGLLMEEVDLDPRTSRITSRLTLIEPTTGGAHPAKEFELRVYTCAELAALMRRHGLEVVEVWGGADRSAYSAGSRRLILLATRNA
jgi:SAM-dependent methyltransferase